MMQNYDSIFIIGTGRSGTNHLCRSLLDFNNITDYLDGKENSKILKEVAVSAIKDRQLDNSVIDYYETQIDTAQSDNKIFLDQCHPNIHHYQQLSDLFKNALFLGIERPVEQIVASMLNHGGVLNWYKKIKNNEFKNIRFPNNFFGVESADELDNLPLHILCAKRALSHKKMSQALAKNENVKLINFENFVEDKPAEINRLFTKDEIDYFGDYHETQFSNTTTLYKYKQVLTDNQIDDILELEKI